MHRRIINILVPTSAFVAGIVVPLLFDKLTNGIVSEQQLTLIVILGFIIALIALVIANSIFFRETTKGQEELIHKQEELVNQVEMLAHEFGLLVHFIEEPLDNNGITYERTQQLIEEAQISLVFLDAWVQTKDYYLGTNLAQERRKSYYNAIIKQIEKHKHDGIQFHRRIVQVPRTVADLNNFKLIGGSLFIDYMKHCLKIRKDSPGTCILRIAPIFLQAHFVIIDRRYVVWPLLTYASKGEGMKRHGAIIFDDPLEQLVPRLMSIFDMIDSRSQPFEPHHLGLNSIDDL